MIKRKKKDETVAQSLKEDEIRFMKAYSIGPYDDDIKKVETNIRKEIEEIEKSTRYKKNQIVV